MAAQAHGTDTKLDGIDDDDVAPAHVVTQLLKELLEAIKAEDFEKAFICCKRVLRFEPGNSLASRYLTICKKHIEDGTSSDDDASESKSSHSSDEGGSSSDSDSDAEGPAGMRESKRASAPAGAGARKAPIRHK